MSEALEHALENRPRRFRPYPEYKNSGIEWLRRIPTHWNIDRLRITVTGCQNGMWGEEPDGNHDIPCVRVADFDRLTFRVNLSDPTLRSIESRLAQPRLLVAGDLLLEKSGGGEKQPVGAVVLYDHDDEAVCSNFIAQMPVAAGFVPRFLTYLHSALYTARINIRSIKQSTGIQNLDSGSYLSERIGFPERQEQQAIAAFLDRETAKIDALVAKKGRLIELLKEKRTGLITRAVTKGLDPNVPIKDSGVEWLGEIPAHWELKPLQYLIRAPLAYGVLKPDKYEGDDGVPLIRILDVEMGQVREEQLDRISPEQSQEYRRTLVNAGDFVVSVVGTIGRCFLVPSSLSGANLSRAFARVQLNDGIESHFLEYYFDSTPFHSFVELIPAGTAQRVLNLGELAKFPVVLPVAIEQQEIVQHLDRRVSKINRLIENVRHGLYHLSEFRSALISAAVTGKIDVREEVA